MNINKKILLTIVKNSGGRLEGEQEIIEINEQQLSTISKELTKLFSLHGVNFSLPLNDVEEINNQFIDVENALLRIDPTGENLDCTQVYEISEIWKSKLLGNES